MRKEKHHDGIDNSVVVYQDARLYAGLFDGAKSATLEVASGRRVYVHVARGGITVNGIALKSGDALKTVDEGHIELSQGIDVEVLVFDLA